MQNYSLSNKLQQSRHRKQLKKRSVMNELGQTMLETALTLPILISLIGLFLFFVYDQLCSQVIEHILHEALICEKTMIEKAPKNYCLRSATQKMQKAHFIGRTHIFKVSNEYFVELNILGDSHWKTIHLKDSTF
jgi:hypothetical protein